MGAVRDLLLFSFLCSVSVAAAVFLFLCFLCSVFVSVFFLFELRMESEHAVRGYTSGRSETRANKQTKNKRAIRDLIRRL